MSFSAIPAEKPVVLEMRAQPANTAVSAQPKKAPATINGHDVSHLPPGSHNQQIAKCEGICLALLTLVFIAGVSLAAALPQGNGWQIAGIVICSTL